MPCLFSASSIAKNTVFVNAICLKQQNEVDPVTTAVDNRETYSAEVTNAESKILVDAGEQKVGDFLAKRRDIPHSGFYG